jgi:uncharacterized membrane protein (DUF4010 family)
MEAAVAVGGAVFLLLHFKEPVHSVISALGANDMRAIVQFALVTLIVLPLLPDRGFGPQAALNPREIWWMVVLVVSMNLVGYVATKLLATRSATLLAGVLGGAVSSTATTVSVARRSRTQGSDPAAQALVGTRIIAAAWAMSLLRTLIEVAVVAPSQWLDVAAPLALMLAWMLLLGAATWWRGGHGEKESPVNAPGNPAELRAALVFAALYALVVLAVAMVKGRFGASALYPVAIVGGLTDTDAVTLSTSNLMARERLVPEAAWQLILLAALANIAVKGAWAGVVGSPPLRKRIAVLTMLALGGGAGILAAWR